MQGDAGVINGDHRKFDLGRDQMLLTMDTNYMQGSPSDVWAVDNIVAGLLQHDRLKSYMQLTAICTKKWL